MKWHYIIILFAFVGCSAQTKLKVETILATPKIVTAQDPETGKKYQKTNFVTITQRLEPAIVMHEKNEKKIRFSLQGNINSGGHSIHKVRKIRFEKEKSLEHSILLKYYVEIVYVAGKEGANVRGYNYSKEETYTIPKGIKDIKIELYQDRVKQRTSSKNPKLKLVAQQIVEFSTNI